MSVVEARLLHVKRELLKKGVDLDELPPFAVTEEDFWSLATRREWAQENPMYFGSGVFTVQGLRCMKAS